MLGAGPSTHTRGSTLQPRGSTLQPPHASSKDAHSAFLQPRDQRGDLSSIWAGLIAYLMHMYHHINQTVRYKCYISAVQADDCNRKTFHSEASIAAAFDEDGNILRQIYVYTRTCSTCTRNNESMGSQYSLWARWFVLRQGLHACVRYVCVACVAYVCDAAEVVSSPKEWKFSGHAAAFIALSARDKTWKFLSVSFSYRMTSPSYWVCIHRSCTVLNFA